MTDILFKNFLSGVLIGMAALLAAIHLVLSAIHVPLENFWHHALPIAYIALFLLGFRKPVHEKLLSFNLDIKPLLYVIEWFLVASISAVYLSVRYLKPTYFIIISVFISAMVVSIGWWVQGIIATAKQRRQHTVNTIIQTRVSDVYQSKLSEYNLHFRSTDTYINKTLAKDFAKNRNLTNYKQDNPQIAIDQLEKSLYGAMYLINFFEFISAGIQKRDLDKHLLKDCFQDVVRNLERKCFHLIWHYRESQTDVFKEFEHLCNDWLGENSLIRKARAGERFDKSILGKPYPNKKWIKKIRKS